MDEIIRMMVGRVIYEQPKEKSNVPPDAPIVLEARHLLSKDVKDVSFVLHKGEILGFAGPDGRGAHGDGAPGCPARTSAWAARSS